MKYLIFSLLLLLIPSVNAADVYVFSSPENSFSALSLFVQEQESFNISVYEFTSPDLMGLVLQKADKILVEKNPVAGISEIEERILCNLENYGTEVKMYSSPHKFLHAKYAIGRDSVLVLSENLGSGFFENRGWGAIIKDEKVKNDFRKVFEIDFENASDFNCDLQDYEIEYDYVSGGKIRVYKNQSVETVFAPDNSVDKILNLLDSANKSIYIQQFYVYRNWGSKSSPKPNLFLEKVLDKAQEGLEIKVLLDSRFYNTEKGNPNSNLNLVNFLNGFASEKNLDIEAKLADLKRIGVNTVHNKGIIVDEKAVLISSINWNENSPTKNREAGVIIQGHATEYFTELFKSDFQYIEKTSLTGNFIKRGTEMFIIIILTIIVYEAFKYLKRGKKNFAQKQTHCFRTAVYS